MSTVLVTGANGFIGKSLCNTLVKRDYDVKGVIRSASNRHGIEKGAIPIIGDIVASHINAWRNWLDGVDIVIHLAACVHQHRATEDLYWQVNTHATSRLYRLAAEVGVGRFVYLSTVKVNGEASTLPFSENDTADPQGTYALSKWQAENEIRRVAHGKACDFVILRPPLVYGPGVRANFHHLLKLVSTGIPLPLASLHNRRSMIYVGNLVDAVVSAMESLQSSGQLFMVSDGQDLTVAEMARTMAVAMGRKPRQFPFPISWLQWPLTVMGRGEMIGKLSRSLTVDASKIRDTLGWCPPFSVQEGIADTVAWFKAKTERDMTAFK